MLRSLYAGVSGLKVHQVKMDVIGNNIANVNTTGFKSSSMTFKEMLSQTVRAASEPTAGRGGLNPMQIGLGVEIGSIDTDFSQGNLQATGKMTDIAIQGNGFFVLADGAKHVYSRAGAFTFDAAGNFIHRTTGYRVKGWMADANGNWPNMNPSTMENLSLGELTMSPAATTEVKYKGNLDNNKGIADITYSPDKTTISDANGNAASLYITSERITGANTPDRADDRWRWDACTDIYARDEAQTVAAYGTAINLSLVDVDGTAANDFQEIVQNTVAVTNLAGDTTYVEGTDYTVDYTNGTITVLDTGNIALGDILVDYDMRDRIATGEISLDETGAVNTNTLPSFQLTLRDTAGHAQSPIDIDAPQVGQKDAGSFVVTTAGINSRPIEGEYGPLLTTSQTVYDSKGTKYTLNISFVKTGENRWDWFASNPVDVDGNELQATNSSGTVFFDAYGKVMGTPSGGPITFQPAGAERVSIAPDFAEVTQFDDDDSATAYDADGYEAGSLNSFSVDGMGTVIGSYSNGLTKQIAKIAIASFSNPAGLTREGDTVFAESNNSGSAEFGLAASGGRGMMSAGTLEMSNVDLADQFTEMITTQRGFQASSKIMQTADQILQDLVNLKR